MDDMRLSDLNLSAWRKIASEHLKSEVTLSGQHQYIYLKGTDQIAQFDKDRGQGYSKITYTQLLRITQQKMKECTDAQERYLTKPLLETLINRVTEMEETKTSSTCSLLFNKSFRSTAILRSARSYLETIRPQFDIISTEMQTILPEVLQKANGVSRSRDGKEGVYFPQMTTTSPACIFKYSMTDPRKCIAADRFYEKFGYVTSRSCAVHNESELGQQTVTFLREKGNAFFESEQGRPNISDQKKKFNEQLNTNRYVIVLREIKGTSFTQTGLNEKKKLLQDDNFLKSLGEMIFLDAAIANTDRLGVFPGNHLIPPVCNTGNFMILREGDFDSRNRRIALIDHEYNLSPESFDAIRDNLFRLLNPKDPLLEQIVLEFLQEIGSTDPEEKVRILGVIRTGLEKAKDEFVKKFNDSESAISLFDFPNDSTLTRFDHTLLAELANCL